MIEVSHPPVRFATSPFIQLMRRSTQGVAVMRCDAKMSWAGYCSLCNEKERERFRLQLRQRLASRLLPTPHRSKSTAKRHAL